MSIRNELLIGGIGFSLLALQTHSMFDRFFRFMAVVHLGLYFVITAVIVIGAVTIQVNNVKHE